MIYKYWPVDNYYIFVVGNVNIASNKQVYKSVSNYTIRA